MWTTGRYRNFDERVRRAERRLRQIGLLADLKGPARLLDIGCGGGENLFCISRHVPPVAQLAGIDISREAISRAARLLQERADVQTASGCRIPHTDKSFTHVTMFGVMEHIRDDVAVREEIDRILQPGGKLYITTSNNLSLVSWTTRLRKLARLFPYGYQRDWSETEIWAFLQPRFEVRSIEAASGDWDMPVARIVDDTLCRVHPMWGRYLLIEAAK